MSRKYKFGDKTGAYFISFATVFWIDVFTRKEYFGSIVESLDYCRKNKGMEIYGYCIMPSKKKVAIFRSNLFVYFFPFSLWIIGTGTKSETSHSDQRIS